MLEARLINGNLLRKLFESIKEMVSDVNLDCDDSGIHMQSMDSSHVALVSFKLADSLFDAYRCDINRTVGLKVETVCKVLKACGPMDTVVLRCDDDGDTLDIVIEHDKDEKMSHLSLKLMQIHQEALGVPDNEFDTVVMMPSRELKNIAYHYDQLGIETVSIDVNKNEIRFLCKGDLGEGSTVLKPTQGDNREECTEILNCKQPVTMSFALRYVKMFANASSLSLRVRVSLTDKQPLEVKFLLKDSDESLGYLRFFLAPKIEEDDDDVME